MSIDDTLVEILEKCRKDVPDFNKKNKDEKSGLICLSFMDCQNCPLNYKDNSGKCKGVQRIYEYVDSLNRSRQMEKSINQLKSDMNSMSSVQKTETQTRLESMNRLKNSCIEVRNKIIRDLSYGDLNPEKMKPVDEPIPIPKIVKSEPKKRTRVWTDEQKRRAAETRRKTLEAKKERSQSRVDEPSKTETNWTEPMIIETQKIDLVLAIIAKRLEMVDEKLNDIKDKIKSLESEGVLMDCVLPDLGKEQLIKDQSFLIEAQELINKYLEIKTSDPNG